MNDKVVIAGTVKLRNTIKAKTNLHNVINGTPSWVVNTGGGGFVPSGTIEITENGVYNVAEYASADVDVQGGITPTGTKQINIASNGTTTEDVTNYASAEITTNVPASAVDTGTKNISTNGTHDVVGYASASVNVPNSYSASDEGKVVSNGALVAQSSDTVTANDTYDTTLINSLTVNVSGSGIRNATGSYTPTETYNTNGNRQITTVATIGFTPKRFIFYAKDRSDLLGTSNCVIFAFANEDDAGNSLLTTIRFTNTSGGIGTNNSTNALTVSNNGYLYLDSGVVYFKTASNAQLIANIDYAWEAYEA